MLAAQKGNSQLIDYFLKKGVKKNIANRKGLTAQQLLLQAFDYEDIDEKTLKQVYPKLMLPAIKIKTKPSSKNV